MKKMGLIAATVFVTGMILVMQKQGRPLKTAATPGGIVSLELAKTRTKAVAFLQAWPGGVARTNTFIDFIFILSYVLFLILATKATVERMSPAWQKAGGWMVKMALMAGMLDVFENIMMLKVINGSQEEGIIRSVYWLASSKFTFAGIAVLFLLTANATRLAKVLSGGDKQRQELLK